jgi:putative membrane protein
LDKYWKKVFKTIPENMFDKTKVIAANQGLYNGFLAAGLIWSLLLPMRFDP